LRGRIQKIMQTNFSVYRDGIMMQEGLDQLEAIEQDSLRASIPDGGGVFNVARIEALETINLLSIALATARGAIYRKESRGAHSRTDFPQSNPEWRVHVWVNQEGGMQTVPVRTATEFMPEVVPV
jgi:succinate dehydrogenase / fumarate reductase flavoprotein subunit